LAIATYGALVFNSYAPAHDGEVADRDLLADGGQVGYEHFFAKCTTSIEDCSGSDEAPAAEAGRRLDFVLRDGAVGGTHGLFSDRGMVIYADIVAYNSSGMQDDVVPDLAPHPDY